VFCNSGPQWTSDAHDRPLCGEAPQSSPEGVLDPVEAEHNWKVLQERWDDLRAQLRKQESPRPPFIPLGRDVALAVRTTTRAETALSSSAGDDRPLCAIRRHSGILWREPDCSVDIINTLAIEGSGERGGRKPPMIGRPVSRDQRRLNMPVCQKKPLEPKHVWSIRGPLEIARSWRNLVIFRPARRCKWR
jgi:hypothetical protein